MAVPLLVLLALMAGCAGDAGTDGGDAVTDDTGDAPYDEIDSTAYRDHWAALEESGSYTFILAGDVVIGSTGSTARIEERHEVDLDEGRFFRTQAINSGEESITSTEVYVPSISRDGNSTGYERITIVGRSQVQEKEIDVSGRTRSTPAEGIFTELDYGDPAPTTLNGTSVYRYEARDPSATVNSTETGNVESASLYLDPGGSIRRIELDLDTGTRTIQATYRYLDIGTTEVETPDWAPSE